MFRPRTYRWVSAFALLAGLPAWPQAQVSPDQHAIPAQPSSSISGQSPAAAQSILPTSPSSTQPVTVPNPPGPKATPEQLGDSLSAHQRYQAAVAAYASEPHPSDTLWNKMGIAYQMMFNLKDATRCYRESLKLNPHNAQVYNNLGTVYDSGKDFREGEKMYRKALKLDPKSAITLKNLGTNLLSQHKYNKGWQAYQEALTIDPNIFQNNSSPKTQNPAPIGDRGAMNYFMARGCVRMGQTDCALEYLRLALNEGYTDAKKVQQDQDFAALRSNPAFQQLLAEQKQQKPQNP